MVRILREEKVGLHLGGGLARGNGSRPLLAHQLLFS